VEYLLYFLHLVVHSIPLPKGRVFSGKDWSEPSRGEAGSLQEPTVSISSGGEGVERWLLLRTLRLSSAWVVVWEAAGLGAMEIESFGEGGGSQEGVGSPQASTAPSGEDSETLAPFETHEAFVAEAGDFLGALRLHCSENGRLMMQIREKYLQEL